MERNSVIFCLMSDLYLMKKKITLFSDVMLCILVETYRLYGGTCSFQSLRYLS